MSRSWYMIWTDEAHDSSNAYFFEKAMDPSTPGAMGGGTTLTSSSVAFASWIVPSDAALGLTWPETGTYSGTIDVSTMGANVALGNPYLDRFSNDGATFRSHSSPTLVWDSTTGTGLHTASVTNTDCNNTGDALDDRASFRFIATTSSTMRDNALNISTGSSVVFTGPWSAEAAATSLPPVRPYPYHLITR